MKNEYLTPLLAELESIQKQLLQKYDSLTQQQLNWSPSPKVWSIAQCIDHTILANKAYFPLLVQLGNGTKKTKKREKLPLLPDVWGKWLVRTSRPNSRLNKLMAPEAYLPSDQPIATSILQEFREHQEILINLIQKTDQVSHDSTVITSPRNGLVTYSLKDCCKLILQHEQLHLGQAEKIFQDPNFPSSS